MSTLVYAFCGGCALFAWWAVCVVARDALLGRRHEAGGVPTRREFLRERFVEGSYDLAMFERLTWEALEAGTLDEPVSRAQGLLAAGQAGPRGLWQIMPPREPGRPEWKAMRSRYHGPRSAHRTMVLGEGMKVEPRAYEPLPLDSGSE